MTEKKKKPHGRPRKLDDEGLEKLAERLRAFAKREDALRILTFTCEEGLLSEDIPEFAKRSESFRQALAYAKDCIAERSHRLAAAGKYHFGVYNRVIRIYDRNLDNKIYDEIEQECKIKSKYGQDAQPAKIEISVTDYKGAMAKAKSSTEAKGKARWKATKETKDD